MLSVVLASLSAPIAGENAPVHGVEGGCFRSLLFTEQQQQQQQQLGEDIDF